jgi:hypothetical protein
VVHSAERASGDGARRSTDKKLRHSGALARGSGEFADLGDRTAAQENGGRAHRWWLDLDA